MADKYSYEKNITRSHTVWYEEIHRGFIELFGELFHNRVPVYVRKPDEDFKVEKFPCIILQVLDTQFSIPRWYKFDSYVVARDKENFRGILDKTPLPFDISYQIDFYAIKQKDLDELNVKWLFKFRRDLVLPVKCRGWERDGDTDYEDGVLVLPEGRVRRIDQMSGKDRLFRSCHTYNVHAKIEEHNDRVEIPLLRYGSVRIETEQISLKNMKEGILNEIAGG